VSESNAGGDLDKNPVDSQDEKVSYSSFKKVLTEKKNIQERMESLQGELENLKLEKQNTETKKMEEQGEYKKLLDLNNAELAKVKGDNELLAKELTTTWKKQAFFGKLKGQLKKPEYEKFIDLNSIVLNPETHQVEEASVDNAVKVFSESYADLLLFPNGKSLPSNAATTFAPKSVGTMNSTEKNEAFKNALTNLITSQGR